MWVVSVCERCRLDGIMDGGGTVYCETEEELQATLYELQETVDSENLTDIYPFHSLTWHVQEVDSFEAY